MDERRLEPRNIISKSDRIFDFPSKIFYFRRQGTLPSELPVPATAISPERIKYFKDSTEIIGGLQAGRNRNEYEAKTLIGQVYLCILRLQVELRLLFLYRVSLCGGIACVGVVPPAGLEPKTAPQSPQWLSEAPLICSATPLPSAQQSPLRWIK
ncbi:hypothetical protein F25303_9772 [Fusarium sp. NRRL 25303]|nr:hypothetical protein F25303_9772 [Fusarium sp. NRRL 25303]